MLLLQRHLNRNVVRVYIQVVLGVRVYQTNNGPFLQNEVAIITQLQSIRDLNYYLYLYNYINMSEKLNNGADNSAAADISLNTGADISKHTNISN